MKIINITSFSHKWISRILEFCKKNNSTFTTLFFVYFFITFWKTGDKIDSSPLGVEGVIKFFEIKNIGANGFIFNNLIRLFFVLLPIIAVTLIEFYKRNKNKLNTLESLSIYKIRTSEGYPYADIWYFILTLLKNYVPFFVTLLTLGIIDIDNNIENWFHNIYESTIPIPSSIVVSSIIMLLAVLTEDLLFFIKHRISHSLAFSWDWHEFHHSATQMTIFSSYRNVVIEYVWMAPFSLPIEACSILLVNEYLSRGYFIPVYIYIFFRTVHQLTNYVGHSSLKVIYPAPFKHIFMSPSLHWIHHSANPKHFDKNFGAVFVFWDKLCGTYMNEEHLKDINEFGVPNSDYNKHHPLYCFTILPILKFTKRIKNAL